MKKLYVSPLIVLTSMTLLAGCAWQVGGDKKYDRVEPTVGQQLIDLQKAHNTGAINDAEYQREKTKLLASPEAFRGR